MPCRVAVGGYAGLDLRGDGGYVVAPPTRHASGRTYEWDTLAHVDDVPIAPCPPALLTLAGEMRETVRAAYTPQGTAALPPRAEWLLSREGSRLRARYERHAHGLRDTTPSGVDASLASLAALAGLEGPEVEAVLRTSRAAGGAPAKGVELLPQHRGHGARGGAGAARQRATPRARDRGGPGPCVRSPRGSAEMYPGVVGEIVEAFVESTEAAPEPIALQFIVAAGSAMGRGPALEIGATRHGVNENLIVAGKTSKARKGDGKGIALRVLELADPDWAMSCGASGLSSGEGLVHRVRDPIEKRNKKGEIEVVDDGVTDKRLLVVETEFTGVLKVMVREGNTLSPVLRDSWDGKRRARHADEGEPDARDRRAYQR